MRALCHIDTIQEGASKGFELDDVHLFVVRHQGQVYAYRNQCPHLGIQLEWQDDQFLDADGCLIQCAMHGALFLIDNGECISGPCTGQSLKTIKCEVKAGEINIEWPLATN